MSHGVTSSLCTYTDLLVHTQPALKVLPDYDGRLNSFTFLSCIIEPRNATVESRWLLPNGQIVTVRNASLTKHLKVAEGEIGTLEGGSAFGSVLIVRQVSYEDAGVYTCEVKDLIDCECEVWPAVSSAELQFQGEMSYRA